jgi:CRP-like cAMP-binding protein
MRGHCLRAFWGIAMLSMPAVGSWMTGTNRLLQLLPQAELAGLNENFRTMELRQGDVLAEPGDDIRSIYFPHSGIVSFMVELLDGSLVQTGMVGRDGVIGAAQAIDGKRSINKIVVQVPGTALVIDRDPLRQLLDGNSPIRKVLAAHEQFWVADIQQTAACNACHPAEARIARWLLRMRDLVGDHLAITQDDLGAMIGIRRGTVSTVAATLREAGIINYARGLLHIGNVEDLEKHSCECHRAVRENYAALLGASWPTSN